MTHFGFKTLLPALLHLEDCMSVADGLELRVPFLDHALVELATTIPSDVKFKDGGTMKHVLKTGAPRLPRGEASTESRTRGQSKRAGKARP